MQEKILPRHNFVLTTITITVFHAIYNSIYSSQCFKKGTATADRLLGAGVSSKYGNESHDFYNQRMTAKVHQVKLLPVSLKSEL